MKYGNVWGGWCTKKVTNAYGVSLWRFIRGGWLNFSKLLRYDVGDGTRVKFWQHVWCGDCTLKKAFPYLFCVSRARYSSVAEVMCWFGGRMHCKFQFCHPLQDWEYFFLISKKIILKNTREQRQHKGYREGYRKKKEKKRKRQKHKKNNKD